MTRKTRRKLRSLKTLLCTLLSLLGCLLEIGLHLVAWLGVHIARGGEQLVDRLVVRIRSSRGPAPRRRLAQCPARAARPAPRALTAPLPVQVPGQGEAVASALRNLGYPAGSARKAAEHVLSGQPGLPLQQAVKAALAELRPQ